MNIEEKLEILKQAIEEKRLVAIVADTDSKGRIERECVPYDHGPSQVRNWQVCFHFLNLDSPSPKGPHIFSCLENDLISIKLLNKKFDPAEYITEQIDWYIERNWGEGLS